MLAFPLPPPETADQATSSTGQAIMEVAIGLAVIGVIALAVRQSRKHGTWLPAAVATGALLSALIEPLPDVVANLWYYAPGQHTIYTAFGNPFPIWTWFSYLVFYGGGGLWFWLLIEHGADRRRIYLACVPLAIYLGAAELFMINVMKVYTYYGEGAFVLAHFPLWIPLLNTSIIVMIGTSTARIRRALAPRDQLLVGLLLPSMAMVLGLLLAPAGLWTALHTSHPSTALVYGATLLAIALAVALIRTATLLIPAEGVASSSGTTQERVTATA